MSKRYTINLEYDPSSDYNDGKGYVYQYYDVVIVDTLSEDKIIFKDDEDSNVNLIEYCENLNNEYELFLSDLNKFVSY